MPVGVAELVVGHFADFGVAAAAVAAAVADAVELQLVAAHCDELATELVAAVHVPAFGHSDESAAGLVVNEQVD